jgi:hypothetical protein
MMKTKMNQFFWLLTLAASSLFIACSDDGEDKVTVDKTALEAKIQVATDLHETSTEGTATGQFQFGSKAILQTAIDLAKQVVASETVTQVQVDNSVTTLTQAITAFEGKTIVPIEPTALVGHWTFDDGTGTVAMDHSGGSRDGTLKAGLASNGAGIPAWATDRYGNAKKALAFDKGAWVEVPYSSAINPGQITICLWAKANVIKGGNKFLGLNRWEGYKFQLQDTPKAFFTGATVADGIFDRDTDPVLSIDTWYHLVVTFGGGHTTFYVNGIAGTDWDNTPGTLAPVTGHNLSIGVESNIAAEAGADFFDGSLDEIRIYNKVLTASQVKSIYDLEKAP